MFDDDKLCIPAYIICYCFKDKSLEKNRKEIIVSLLANTRTWKLGSSVPCNNSAMASIFDSSFVKPLIDFEDDTKASTSTSSDSKNSMEAEIANLTKLLIGMRTDIDELKTMMRSMLQTSTRSPLESLISGI